ncbi:MAG: SpoIIE family protein phosphatase [Acidobacteriota bacterium]|nr:SpoIIE family protein phosphatase [Acidobacteriota bacterium]
MTEQIKENVTVQTIGLTVVDKLRLLLDITKKISRSLDIDEVLNLVMDTLDSLLPYDAAGIYLVEQSDIRSHAGASSVSDNMLSAFRTTAVRGYDIDELTELHLKVGEGLLGHVAQTGAPVIVPDVRLDERYLNARRETRSEMIAPIISNDEVIGVFDLESDELNAYTQDDLQVLLLLASQVAIIIEKARLHEQLIEKKRLEAQLEVARQVQLELLPARQPQLEGFDISAYNFSTEEVSGDYYDFYQIYDDHLGIVIADVSGKGVPAALLMAFLRASLRAAIHIGYAPNISLAKINYLLWESIKNNQFVTAFYGVLDTTNKTLAYANAGHNPPLLIDATGRDAQFIERGGLPLGMFRDSRYYEYYLPIEAGQTLVLYTDGLTEAEGADGVEYGRERLAVKVREGLHLSAEDIIKFLYEDILEWTQGRGSGDDVTMVIVKAL